MSLDYRTIQQKVYAWWNPLGMIQKRWVVFGLGVAAGWFAHTLLF